MVSEQQGANQPPDQPASSELASVASVSAALPETTALDSMAGDVAEIETALKKLDGNASPMCDACQIAWAASTDSAQRVALLSCIHP